MPHDDCIEYAHIRICNEFIEELDGGRRLIAVQRSGIERVELRWGWRSQRPFIQMLFGTVLSVLGMFPSVIVLRWLLGGGTLHWIVLALAGFLLLFGGWVMYDSLRRGYFLAVEGQKGRKKLCFARAADRQQIEAFLREAQRRFGYEVERDLG